MPPLADILLERFVYPGRLPPDLSPAQSPSRTGSLPPHLPDRGTDLVCPDNPDHSLFFLLALPTSASTACWTALSRGFHFYRQFETGTSDLVLKREPYELSFALVERLRETCSPLRTNRSPPLLNITEVRPRYAKKLSELGKASLI